ncbi:regucalcin-like isoform X2 [Contarinia nasturtii]|uniref:regucalcin-like isoform X2 n=1 Tax=Contarinia nasturtii TaxID=265458 RepID=UPI0012D3790F|nr:regucalcin-like isoform X2 [Contarinia nasturtii]
MHKPFIIFIFVFINCVICNEITPISPKNWAKPYSPFYDAACNRLLMVDFANGTLINYNLKSQIIYESRIPGISNPSFMIPIKCRKNKFLVSNGLSTAIIKWNGVEPEAQVVETLFSVETSQEFINNNWNQASVSPQFRFYGGTYRRGMCGDMPPTTGAVYRYDKCKSVKKIIPNVKVTGGIEWNAKGDTMYFVDPCQKVIWAYDYIKNTGTIKNGRIVFVYQGGFGDANTIPLGLAIDRKEYLYVTLYGGGAVLKVDPRYVFLLFRFIQNWTNS